MTNRFRIAATLPRQLEEVGVSPAPVLSQARLPISLFDHGKVWLTTEEMFALYAAIEQVSGDPAIGLKLGSGKRPEHYSPIHIAALHTRSFRDALNRIARYKRLMGPEEIHLVERAKECGVQFVWLLAGAPEPSTLVDLCFAWTVSVGRRGTGRTIDPLRVEFARPEANRRLYERHFGCPVKFAARHNKIFFRIEDVERPFVTYNPDLLEVVAPQLEAELAQELAATSFKEQLKGVLKRFLAGRKPRLEDAAREMRVSARTLQRRLLDEGLSFQGLIEEARREMARHYLRQPSLELIDTAYLLGYEDPNSFIRAFQKWEGTSPGQWRSNHSPGVSLTQ
ncbi:MAG TPA: AraC family transcriptional regulator [Candidatus Acidoferrales bacterium]|nr:AraC family transcriptional regulator [Candidatus Acidoferrales bacterium]